MNHKGFTILELLISIALISVVLLLLLKVMMSLEVINHDTSYASDDEIARTEMIKKIEQDFLDYHLNGLTIKKENDSLIIELQLDELKRITVTSNSIMYDDEEYFLKSKNASNDLCLDYEYMDLEQDYYLLTFSIPVLIEGVNTTKQDDLTFTYLGMKNENTSYPSTYTC